MMTASNDYGSGSGSGLARGRHARAITIGTGFLILCWFLGTSSLVSKTDPFLDSGTTSIKPQAGSAVDPPAIPMAGDDFYTDDAVDHFTAPPPPPPEPAFKDNVAVIMETNPAAVPQIVPIILHFVNILGPHWPVVLLTMQANWIEPESPAFRRAMAEGKIRIMFLPQETAITDHHSVSIFLTSPWFWEQFADADRLLMFQADSVLCSKSPLTVDDFVQYDLVGAPIERRSGVGYNGGLSLRNPKLFLDVTRDPAHNFTADSGGGVAKVPNDMKFEDQWFYNRLRERGANLPDQAVARTFSVETIYYATPLGYHQPARWQKKNMAKILNWCPEAAMIQQSAQHFSSSKLKEIEKSGKPGR